MPINYRRWGLILSIVGVGATIITGITAITTREVRCFFRLESCLIEPFVNFKLVVVIEELKPLEGVEAVFIPVNSPPETKTTDSDGYGQIKIPRKGDIEVKLSKDGYKTLTRTINLEIEAERTRTFILKKADDIGRPSPSSTIINTLGSSPSPVSVDPEPECIHKSLWQNPNDYSGEIVVARTIQKPDRRIN